MRNEIVFNLPAATYRAELGVSYSELKTLADSVPAAAAAYRSAINEPTEAMIFGTLFHTALLEPEQFEASHYIAPDGMKFNTTEGKQWKAAHSDKPILKATGDMSRATIERMLDSVYDMPDVARMLAWKAQNEVSVFAVDAASGLQLKCRPDRFAEEDDDGVPAILDVKTTDNPCGFERTAAALGYYMQDAFYRRVVASVHREPRFLFITVGRNEPYAVRVGTLSQKDQALGEKRVTELLAFYKRCADADSWPAFKVREDGACAGIETFQLPRWLHSQAEIQ